MSRAGPIAFSVLLGLSGAGSVVAGALQLPGDATTAAILIGFGLLSFGGAYAAVKGSDPRADEAFRQKLAEAQDIQFANRTAEAQRMLDENRGTPRLPGDPPAS